MLPRMTYSDNIQSSTQVQFGGYNHTKNASEGDIYDMLNMTSDNYPLLSTRGKRVTKANLYDAEYSSKLEGTKGLRTQRKGSTLKTYDTLRWVYMDSDFTVFMDRTGVYISEASSDYCTKIYDAFGNNEAEYSVARIGDFIIVSQIGGNAYCIDTKITGKKVVWAYYDDNISHFFKPSELLNIADIYLQFEEGSIVAVNPNENQTSVTDYTEAEYPFDLYTRTASTGVGAKWRELHDVIRVIPEKLDYIVAHNNRLWSAKDNTIRGSALGDPMVWDKFDGLSTDSYAVDVSSDGSFTGCALLNETPVFFKENHIYKLYGSIPSSYQLQHYDGYGILKGSHNSVANINGYLMYLSPIGVTIYNGSSSYSVADVFGQRFIHSVAGVIGDKYYCCLFDGTNHTVFVYDAQNRLWIKEDVNQLELTRMFASYGGNIYAMTPDSIIALNNPTITGTAETDFDSMVEFGDFYDGSPNKKGVEKLQIRCEIGAEKSLTISIQYDTGAWETVKTITTDKKKSFVLPLIPRRCDHYRLKFVGQDFTIYSITRQRYIGSEL